MAVLHVGRFGAGAYPLGNSPAQEGGSPIEKLVLIMFPTIEAISHPAEMKTDSFETHFANVLKAQNHTIGEPSQQSVHTIKVSKNKRRQRPPHFRF